jgi:hypothetical protein
MTAMLVPLAGLGVAVLFFGWIAVMAWMTNRNNERMRAMGMEERLRRLELGLPEVDPDAARAERERLRTILLGLIGLLVPLGVCAALVALTAISLYVGRSDLAQPVLLTAWPSGMAVCLVTAFLSLWLLRRGPESSPRPNTPAQPTNNDAERSVVTGIRDQPPER